MADLAGRTLGGRYRVESFIGRGGMADVYRVWDEQRLVWLAMKVLHEDLAYDKVFLRRFRREAQTLATLQHPNIVRSYGLEEADGLAFMLMDFVEGSTLRKEIALRKVPLALNDARAILQPVCAALHYAHQLGIAHCDVKPGNIMLHKNGTVLVADFGIARLTEAVTTITMVGAGTPAYMAPEQVRGEQPTPRTDIYALGIVLYEMLTGGERPFTGEQATFTGSTSEKVRWEQVNLNPLSPQHFNPTIPSALEAVVLKCLEKDPARRYGSAVELLQAVDQAMLAVAGMGQFAATSPELVSPLPVARGSIQSAINQQAALQEPLPPPQPAPPAPQDLTLASAPPQVPPLVQAAPRRRLSGWLVSLLLGMVLVITLAGVILLGNNSIRSIIGPPKPTATELAAAVVFTEQPYPTSAPTEAPTELPTLTYTPEQSETPTLTPAPQVPMVVQAEFQSAVTPNPDAVISPIVFAQTLDENFQPVAPADVFFNPVGHLYAVFTYELMTTGSQWTAIWYRGGELVHFETSIWEGGTGGLGFVDWNPDPGEWLPGDYELQIFVGLTWKVSGFFVVEGDPPTPMPSPTLTPTNSPTIYVNPTATDTPVPTKKVTLPTKTPTVPPPDTKTPTPPPSYP